MTDKQSLRHFISAAIVISLALNAFLLFRGLSFDDSSGGGSTDQNLARLGSEEPGTEMGLIRKLRQDVIAKKKALQHQQVLRRDYVAIPWQLAKTVIRQPFAPFSSGRLSDDLREMLSMEPAEIEAIEKLSLKALEKIKESESQRVRTIKDEAGATYFEIPPNPTFSNAIADELNHQIESVLGVDRGAILIDAILSDDPFLTSATERYEVAIEQVGDRADFVVRKFFADGKADKTRGKELTLSNLNQLQERYGHVMDFSAWRDYLSNKLD